MIDQAFCRHAGAMRLLLRKRILTLTCVGREQLRQARRWAASWGQILNRFHQERGGTVSPRQRLLGGQSI